MAGQQFATILARTDPFDVAQGLERYIRTLSGEQIREIISAARPRLNEWYRAEFMPLLDDPDDEHLRRAFIHGLKSNLRAIPLFGAAFCEGVIAQIPGDRAVGLGEETRTWPVIRPAAAAIAALALVLGGATVHHLFSAASATARAPVVLMTPEPAVAVATPAPAIPLRSAAPRVRKAVLPSRKPVAVAAATVTPVPAPAPPVAAAPVRPPAPAKAAPVVRPAVRAKKTAPPGVGTTTVVAQRTPVPRINPDDVDTSDMPQAYTDATPLPSEAPPQAHVTAPLAVPTPTPEPNRSWTHRLVHAAVHLVNSTLSTVGVGGKPHAPTPSPSPSPSGPHPK